MESTSTRWNIERAIQVKYVDLETTLAQGQRMASKPRPFGRHLRELRLQREYSVRKLAAISGVEYSLISKIENGRKTAGPVTIEKLANTLELIGDARDAFVQAGSAQSKRSAQAFGPGIANPFFRSVLCDLLRTLGIRGEVREFAGDLGASGVKWDLTAIMIDGRKFGIDFKPGRILVAIADSATGNLPAPTRAVALASGGFVANLTIIGDGKA